MDRDEKNGAGDGPGSAGGFAEASGGDGKAPHVSGEENLATTSPEKDLVAVAVIAALSVFAMVLAVRMPNPGGPFTHPGLLPFLTGLTLLAMVAGLGLSAVREGGAKSLLRRRWRGVPSLLGDEQSRRTLLLVGIIGIYVLLADIVTFDLRYPTPLFAIWFSSYEAVSIPILTLILRIFWRAPWWRCALVAGVFVIALAAVFRYGFHILLPGAD